MQAKIWSLDFKDALLAVVEIRNRLTRERDHVLTSMKLLHVATVFFTEQSIVGGFIKATVN